MLVRRRTLRRQLLSRLLPRRLRGVLGFDELSDALLREQSRADRTSDCLSMALFDHVPPTAPVRERLAQVLIGRIRTTDLVGQMRDQRLAVVLPSTSGRGAWVFADHILSRLSEVGIESACEVYTYPHNWTEEEDRKDRVSKEDGASAENRRHPSVGVSLDPMERASAVARPEVQADPQESRQVKDLTDHLVVRLPRWRRILDLVVSATMLILLSPMLLLTAVAIRLTSPGPVIFRQKRAGIRGEPFTFYKFRSMYVDAEERRQELEARNEKRGPIFKIREDPRMTPIGGLLRKTSIDELPQLWNVLKGDMTLIGPRPPTLNEIPQYDRWQTRRLNLKGGLTCIWQVSGRSEIGFDDWVRMDLRYLHERSFLLDMVLLARTAKAVMTGKGAY